MKRLVLQLTLLAGACGLLTSLVQYNSAERITLNQLAYRNQLLLQVAGLPSADLAESQDSRFVISLAQEPVGIIFPISTGQGYNGTIRLWLAVNLQGEILGVRVYAHGETPGLGDKIDLQVANWVLDFNGKSLVNTAITDWAVKRDGGKFDQFSGATITPRAVVAAVHAGLTQFHQHQQQWLEETP
jgi:Na+-translocating ferredoxin:NAD+ oxidoreductase subunit G